MLRPRYALTALATALLVLPAWMSAQEGYQKPPAVIQKLMDAPSAPRGSISPDRKWLVVSLADRSVRTIADVAEPKIDLAGSTISPKPNSKVQNIGIQSLVLKSIE